MPSLTSFEVVLGIARPEIQTSSVSNSRMLSYVWACLTCSQAPSLAVNSHSYSIVRLLGDGGYAFVYLVTRDGTDKQYALKKIRCLFGGESVANAMREVEACNTFRSSELVVSCIDSAVVQEADGTKTVYLVLPYYANGNLQDRINENIVSNKSFSEQEVILYALGTARALSVMHSHRSSSHTDSNGSGRGSRSSLSRAPAEASLDNQETVGLLRDDEDDSSAISLGELQPYAHRDIKPANIMIEKAASGENRVVLIDLGSCSPARVSITTRIEALEMQDLAAEHCTLPFRAPELFDVRTGTQIDEKVDIWGLGCTIFALMYSVSPFEHEEQIAGASIIIAISRGKFTFPETPEYSQNLKDLVRSCLNVVPSERPDTKTVIDTLERLSSD